MFYIINPDKQYKENDYDIWFSGCLFIITNVKYTNYINNINMIKDQIGHSYFPITLDKFITFYCNEPVMFYRTINPPSPDKYRRGITKRTLMVKNLLTGNVKKGVLPSYNFISRNLERKPIMEVGNYVIFDNQLLLVKSKNVFYFYDKKIKFNKKDRKTFINLLKKSGANWMKY